MKIYLTHSTSKLVENRNMYEHLRSFLIDKGYTLTYDWLPDALKHIAKGTKKPNYQKIYRESVVAIDKADIVIIEDTVSSFSTGHQITLAIQRKKPTLVLWGKNKNKHFENSYLHAIKSEYLQIQSYDKDNLEEVISSFINKYGDIGERHRFNLVISDLEKRYLEWAQHHKNMSKTA
jgi:hypothetical protein